MAKQMCYNMPTEIRMAQGCFVFSQRNKSQINNLALVGRQPCIITRGRKSCFLVSVTAGSVDSAGLFAYKEQLKMSTLKIQFICEVCTARLIVECDESVWTFKHYCEDCQAERTFLRDVVICDPSSYPPYSSVPDSIYLFKAGHSYKIGISKDPNRRIYDFSISPIPVEFVWSAQVENARALEKQLHRRFQEKNVYGEWFELDEADIEYIKGLGAQDG